MLTWTEAGSSGGFLAEIKHHLIYEKIILALLLKRPFKGANREGRRPAIQEKIIGGWTWLVIVRILRSGSSQSDWSWKIDPTGFPDRPEVL